MIVKGFILFALLVCIAESAPMDAMTRHDMSLLKQLLQVAQLQQEEGGHLPTSKTPRRKVMEI